MKSFRSLDTSRSFFLNNNIMDTVLSLFSTTLLVVLIFVVYKNNRDIDKLNDSAVNINQYIKKGEVNDDHIFKTNTDIMNYLRSRDSMKQELELLKAQVKANEVENIEQNKRLEKSDRIDREHNRIIAEIRDTYRSDINYLVNLSLTDMRKHFPNESEDDNLKKYRELLYFYVLLALKEYKSVLPNLPLDKFIEMYGNDVAYVLAESIYTFKVYNTSDGFPTMLLINDEIKKNLKDSVKLNFLIRTYFPRLFTYIETNRGDLFKKLDKISKSTNKSYESLFTSSPEDPFWKFVMKESRLDVSKLNAKVKVYLFDELPTYYARSLYFNSDQNSHINELEDNIVTLPLKSCSSLQTFYKSWKSFNVVKKEGIALVPETEKTQLLKNMISTNKIFKGIYMRRVEQYNAMLSKLPKCDLPTLPIEHRVFYDANDLTRTNEEENLNAEELNESERLSNVLNLL